MICAGIDTSKRKLDVAVDGSSKQLQVGNDGAGHRTLSGWLRQRRVKRVGIEASGGYEQEVVMQLRHDGFTVVVFQPGRCGPMRSFICNALRTTSSTPP
jgi:transposase